MSGLGNGAVLRTLQGIDWDFAVPRSGYVAPPHWYPGTFVPALSDALIEALTPVGGTVFDPYGGIGTTGWSAIRTSRSCRIADVNPVALLVAYATTSLLAVARSDRDHATVSLGALGRAIGRNDDLFGPDKPSYAPSLDDVVAAGCEPAPSELLAQVRAGPPNWDALGRWIAPETAADVQVLMGQIAETRSAYIQLLGLCMVSAVIRSVSSQNASWGHIADNVWPRELKVQNLHAATTRWLKRTRAFVGQPTLSMTKPSLRPYVHRRDWSVLDTPGQGEADLLLTSPPYADAIDYTLAQRLSLYLLGYDDEAIMALVAGEIGARRKRFKSVSRAQWSEQLCAALQQQVTWLKPNSPMCLVLPHRDSGRSAGEEDLKRAIEGLGWYLFFQKDRSIHQSHTRQSWSSIKKETVLVFARG